MQKILKNEKAQKTFWAILSILCLLLVWQLAVTFTHIGQVMEGPIVVLQQFMLSFVDKVGKNTMLGHIFWSFSRMIVGFLAAAAVGITLGVTMGRNRVVEAIFMPLFEMIRPIPPLAWIPLAILWFGLGELPKYFLIFIASFSSITINSYAGAKSVDPVLIGAAKMLGANKRQIFFTVVLPYSVPYIFAGLQIAIANSWATVVAAEMISARVGVGWIITAAQDTANTTQMLVGIVGIGIVGFILAIIMRGVEGKLCAWRQSGR